MDYHQILGVSRTATQDEIKKAYRKRARESHPDRNPGDPGAAERFKQIQSAYEALSSPKPKNQSSHKPKPSYNPFKDIWDDFFTPSGVNPNRGNNIQIRVDIEFKESFLGVVKNIVIPIQTLCAPCEGRGWAEWHACKNCSGSGKSFFKQTPFNVFITCAHCKGTGRSGTVPCADCKGECFITTGQKSVELKIPAGIPPGTQVRIPGAGQPGKDGGHAGDAFIVVMVKEHPVYRRIGLDLIIDVPVTYTELVLGKDLILPLPDGRQLAASIPPGTQNNTILKVERFGFKNNNGNGFGDVLLNLHLEVPTTVDGEYKDILSILNKIESEKPLPKKKIFAENLAK